MTTEPELLTKKAAAKKLGVAPRTVDRLVRDGELEAVEFYGRRRYPDASVSACLERHTVRGKPKEVWPGLEYKPGMKLV
jgi:excisionase family DNA binding protein